MAQYYWDASDESLGSWPADWPGDGDASAIVDVNIEGSARWGLVENNGGQATVMRRRHWTGPTEVAGTKLQIVTLMAYTNRGGGIGFWDVGATWNAYFMTISSPGSGVVYIDRSDGSSDYGNATTIDNTSSQSTDPNERWWLRLEYDRTQSPTVIRGRWWRDGDTEPGTWGLSGTDTTYDSSTMAPLVVAHSRDYDPHFLFVGYGTDGDEAPTSAPATGTTVTVNAASESEAAESVGVLGPISVSVGLVTESEVSQAITSLGEQIASVSVASETESIQPVAFVEFPQPSARNHRAIPESDLHIDTGWRDESSATTDLWSHIDSNQVANLDQEYVESPDSPSSDVFVFGLSEVPDPGVDENVGAYVPRLRAAKTGDDISVTWELRQGYVSEASQGTLIHSESTTVNATDPTDYLAYNTGTFEGIDANAVTDFSDLSIRVVASATSGRLRIYESNFSVPSTELTWKTDFENFGWTVRSFTADGGEEWYEHRRPFVWNPGSVGLHDTGVTESVTSRDLWINGDVSVPGPWYGIAVSRNLDILLISQGYCNHISPGLGDVYADARAGSPPTGDAGSSGSDSLNPVLFSVAAEHDTGDGDNYTAGQLDMFWKVCAYLATYFDIPPEAFVHHREYTSDKPDMQFQGDARGAIADLLGVSSNQIISVGAVIESETAQTILVVGGIELFATGTQTITDVVDETDATTNLHLSVDDDPASPTDSDWVNNAVDVT